MPSIAIIGAGPAGLTLARLLLVLTRVHNISDLKLQIFEHDPSGDARWKQGGTLDLHPSTGIAALKAAHMWDDILPHMRYEGEELIWADMNATTLLHLGSGRDTGVPNLDERPEIDREVLKQCLLEAVKESGGAEAITWDKHLLSADANTGILKFRDGTEAGPFDLVVGADGAWSKIRNVLTDIKPHYSGICGFEGWIDEAHAGKERWGRFTKFVGLGSFFSFSKEKSIMAQRMGDGSMKTAFWARKEASWPADVVETCGGDEDKIRNVLLAEFSEWDEQQKDLLRSTYRFRQWPLYELPVGHSWDHKQGWTLIGDAAHLMTPFAGEGVNAAMKDSLELANAIISAVRGKQALDEAIRKFESDMFPRNASVQKKTAKNKESRFRSDAPVGFMTEFVDDFVVESGRDPKSGWVPWAVPVAKVIAFLYFWSISRIGLLRRRIRKT